MSRYIDADYISKYPIRIDHYDKVHGNRHFVLGIESVMEYIEEAPHIDIVRCKECKHWRYLCDGDFDFTYGFCEHPTQRRSQGVETVGNDFCSYGERRASDT